MGFAGNLRTLSLAEVLQTLNRIQATGVLRIAREAGVRDVVFTRGEIIGVAVPQGAEAQMLLRRLLMEERLDAAAAAQISATGRESQLVEALIQRGLVKADEVEDARRRQAEEELYDIATWDMGDFVFHDAGPGSPDASALVEQMSRRPLRIVINALLIEAARRQDEFTQMQERIPDDRAILGPTTGGENRLKLFAKGYPQNAVIPLIDAVRTIDEVARDSVASRFDVYAVLIELFEKEMIVELSAEDVRYHADYLFGQGDVTRAAALYRHLLQLRGDDHECAARLADCIEAQGDVPEAAASYGQLALGRLATGDREQAAIYAEKAVSLSPAEPRLRLGLIRCLIAAERTAEAKAELRRLSAEHQAAGRLDDARGSLLKVLELDQGDEDARRELARIFSAADDTQDSEDVVVCVSCGHVNHREATNCAACGVGLHLTCLSCNRVVAASDRLCIFCGAEPHGGQRRRKSGGSPTTSRFVDPSRVRAAASAPSFRNQLEKLIHTARALEEGGDLGQALERWREVAKIQVDSPELVRHIKELEGRIQDQVIERRIEQGHQYKRIRRYWKATQAYRDALSRMASDDPRAPRLSAILSAAQRSHLVALGVYGIALCLFLAVGYIAMRPRLVLSGIRDQAVAVEATIAGAATPEDLAQRDQTVAALEARIAEYADSDLRAAAARGAVQTARGVLLTRRSQLFAEAEREIAKELQAGRIDAADRLLVSAQQRWTADGEKARLLARRSEVDRLKADRSTREQRIAEAPGLFATAKAHEEGGELATALVGYAGLELSPEPKVATDAKAAATRLRSRRAAFDAALGEARARIGSDIPAAQQALMGLVAEAKAWNQGEALAAARTQADGARTAADAAWTALGDQPGLAALEAFVAAHPGAAQRTLAQTRIASLRTIQDTRDRALAAHRQLIADKQWERAWASARDLRRVHGAALPAGSVQIPLWIESQPSGAQVALDGRPVGTTPCVLLAPIDRIAGTVTIQAPGSEGFSRPLAELLADWRFAAALARQTRWKIELGKPVTLIGGAGPRLRAAAGEVLAEVGADGAIAFRTALGGDDMAITKPVLHHLSVPVGTQGASVIGLPAQGAEFLGADGAGKSRWSVAGAVRGRPAVFVNEVLGAGQRVAIAAQQLVVGTAGQEPTRIPLPRPAMAGPFAAASDLDRVLVVLTEDGRALGIEDSTRTTVFSSDLRFAEAGQLLPQSANGFAVLLDGQRLAAFQVRRSGIQQRWSQNLPGAAVGDAVPVPGGFAVAVGAQLLRYSAEGAPAPAIALPAPASCAPAGVDDLLVVGCGRMVAVIRAGRIAWTGTQPTPVTAVGVAHGLVLVGGEDGSLRAYAP